MMVEAWLQILSLRFLGAPHSVPTSAKKDHVVRSIPRNCRADMNTRNTYHYVYIRDMTIKGLVNVSVHVCLVVKVVVCTTLYHYRRK